MSLVSPLFTVVTDALTEPAKDPITAIEPREISAPIRTYSIMSLPDSPCSRSSQVARSIFRLRCNCRIRSTQFKGVPSVYKHR